MIGYGIVASPTRRLHSRVELPRVSSEILRRPSLRYRLSDKALNRPAPSPATSRMELDKVSECYSPESTMKAHSNRSEGPPRMKSSPMKSPLSDTQLASISPGKVGFFDLT